MFTLNTNLCPLVVPDTYGTFNEELFSDSCDFDEDDFIRTEFNIELLKEKLIDGTRKAWLEYDIEIALSRVGLKFVDTGDFHSPKYYNYSTDSIDLKFDYLDDFDLDRVMGYVREVLFEDADVTKYVEFHYRSRSGFISFMPCSADEIEEFYNDEHKFQYALSAMIMLSIIYELNTDEPDGYLQEHLYDAVFEDSLYKENQFVSDELVRLYQKDAKMDELFHFFAFDLDDHLLWREIQGTSKKYSDRFDARYYVPQNYASDIILWAHEKHLSADDLLAMMDNAA